MTFHSLEHVEAIIWYLVAQFQCCCVSGNREARGDSEVGGWPVGGAGNRGARGDREVEDQAVQQRRTDKEKPSEVQSV